MRERGAVGTKLMEAQPWFALYGGTNIGYKLTINVALRNCLLLLVHINYINFIIGQQKLIWRNISNFQPSSDFFKSVCA